MGDLAVIANCPSCGTHYKHEPPKVRVRARCGRCDAAVDLLRLSPYRIVSPEGPSSELAGHAASHLGIGLDDPSLKATIAANVARCAPALVLAPRLDLCVEEDPLPQVAKKKLRETLRVSEPPTPDRVFLAEGGSEAFDQGTRGDAAGDAAPPEVGGALTFVLWSATGAIAGTWASWAIGGTAVTGMAAGAMLGVVAGWAWLRWTSPE